MAEDLGQEDIVGLVLGLEPVAADGSVGASEVARSPGLVQGTEGVGNVLGELGAGGGVDGIGAGEGFHGAEVLQGPDNQARLGQGRDRGGLEVSLFSENLPDTECDSVCFLFELLWLNFCQRLLQVGLKIVNIFDTNGQAH